MFIIAFFILGLFVAAKCTMVGAGILAVAFMTGIGIMAQCCLYQDMNYFQNNHTRQKLKKDIKRQDDYDNEWGVIDWHKK